MNKHTSPNLICKPKTDFKIMRIYFTLLWVLAIVGLAHTQTPSTALSPAGLVKMSKTKGLSFESKTLFDLNPEGRNRSEISQAGISTYDHLQLKEEQVQALLAESPETFQMLIPSQNRQEMEVELVKVDLLAEGFRVMESDGNRPMIPEMSVHYRGVVKGVEKSVVAISIFENEVMGLFSLPDQGNIVLGKLGDDNQTPTDQYILYNDQEVSRNTPFECGTPDDGPGYTREQLMDATASGARDVGDCIRIYFEVDNDIYRDKGGSAQVTNYVTGLFNEVATLYANENVNITISEIFIWTSNSPYAGSSSSAMLSQFQNTRRSFNGDLAQLLSYQASGGIAVLDGLCHPYTAARLSFSSINKTYRAIPNYSFSVMVVAHELGHLLGSHHTHACVWNGNNTAIDGCAGFTEGSCGNPGIPSNGGTVMSYCHISSTGINFTKGFGTQPGNVIRNNIASSSCTSACSGGGDNGGGDNGGGDNGGGDNGGGDNGGGDNGGGDNGGGDNGGGDNGGGDNGGGDNGGNNNECNENKVYLDLTLDNFGMETTWELLDANGTAVASGGPYAKKKAGEVIRDSFCLPEACYSLKLMDSDGDGICCAYGQGGYQVWDENGNVYADGGSFESEDMADFCLGQPDDDNDGCLGINFNDYVIESYGSFQDVGDAEIMNNGTTLKIDNNAWKAIGIRYTVTPNTVLQFEFGSNIEGEIHGIGLDDNNTISFTKTFQLYGTQRWGVQNYNTYDGASTWTTYTIPIGEYYTGSYKYMFFLADHDSGFGNGTSFYRNVVLYERENNECYEGLVESTAQTMDLPAKDLSVFPNPAQEELHVAIPGSKSGNSLVRIYNATGQVVEERSVTTPESSRQETLPINHLSQGTYFIQVTQGEQQWSSKFNISRH